MRKPFIAGNWKMYKTQDEAKQLAEGIKKNITDVDGVDVAFCPPYTNLAVVSEAIKDSYIKLGGQNLHWESEGAYTGEISAAMLLSAGCSLVIIGHSERRKYFHETDATVNKRIKSALAAGLLPIVCVGEVLEQREANQTIEVVTAQLEGAFGDIDEAAMEKITIAYEPVWAIGTGKTATPEQAEEVQKVIREWIEKKFSPRCAQEMRILYGGSVKPENITALISQEDVDGALVGGASLKVDSFVGIVKGALHV